MGDCVWQHIRNISFAAEHITAHTCPNRICDQVQCKASRLFLALTRSKWVTSLKADCLQKAELHYMSPKMGPLTPALWGLARLKNRRFWKLSQRTKSAAVMEKSFSRFLEFLVFLVFRHFTSNCLHGEGASLHVFHIDFFLSFFFFTEWYKVVKICTWLFSPLVFT